MGAGGAAVGRRSDYVEGWGTAGGSTSVNSEVRALMRREANRANAVRDRDRMITLQCKASSGAPIQDSSSEVLEPRKGFPVSGRQHGGKSPRGTRRWGQTAAGLR